MIKVHLLGMLGRWYLLTSMSFFWTFYKNIHGYYLISKRLESFCNEGSDPQCKMFEKGKVQEGPHHNLENNWKQIKIQSRLLAK